jgi:hypothetical protein
MSKASGLLIASLLIVTCTGLDDKPLPTDARGQIYFNGFELNAQRNYLLVNLINESPYTLTSCKLKVNIYSIAQSQEDPLILTEVSVNDVMDGEGDAPVLSENFFIRETLKPGYSTEVYFELKLDDLSGRSVFTQEIIELKGKASL